MCNIPDMHSVNPVYTAHNRNYIIDIYGLALGKAFPKSKLSSQM
jgi:hypothetical protein